MKNKKNKAAGKVKPVLKKLEEFTEEDIKNICTYGREKYTVSEISTMLQLNKRGVSTILDRNKITVPKKPNNIQRLYEQGKLNSEQFFIEASSLIKSRLMPDLIYKGYFRDGLRQTSYNQEDVEDCYTYVLGKIKEKYNPDRNYDSIIPVMENSKNFFFIRSKEEDLANLIKNESLYEIKDFCADDFKDLVEETKIIKSNEKKSTESDYKKLFFKQPSQINKENKDFSTYEKVDLKMLGQKTYRNIDANVNEISDEKADLAKMPQSIKDLIKKMESRPPIKANVFEKYKNARKSNSNI